MKITKEKIKKAAKYTVNGLNITNALWLVLVGVWGIPYGQQVSATLVGFSAVISAYLLGDKAYTYHTEGE